MARNPNNDPTGELAIIRQRLSKFSRYQNTLIYFDLGPAHGKWAINKLQIEESLEDDFHTVELGEQFALDYISFKRYNTEQLWWVIALANDIRNPFVAPEVGNILRIPSIHRITTLLLS